MYETSKRLSEGQKLRFKISKLRGERHPSAVAREQKRDLKCIELAPIFVAAQLENPSVSLNQLSKILETRGYLNQNNKPFGVSTLSRYRKRINKMIQEGIIKPPENE